MGRDQYAGHEGDESATVDQASEVVGRTCTAADRHEPHGSHVHPEPASGRSDEGDLDGDRYKTEGARHQRTAEQDLRSERDGDPDAEADHVRRRAGEKCAFLAHAANRAT